ncbi:alcohol dehydrogenase [Caballeronia terrestris]|uniref:Alcohol dehydrogenase n=1 Tax=Caballeronia terrestris TaxID=1226301 RepID=A0A158KUX9_9BURK|nr:alcohol dehydrogenase [Caballeronia terrestris]
MSSVATFLDKDGTLLEDVPYSVDPNAMKLAPGAREALAIFADVGALIFVISNQGGGARGRFEIGALDGVEYSHLTGGYAGGQAEFVRVPFADTTHIKIPDGLTDEQVLFLGDIFPTGWQAAVNCDIEPTDTVAIWGAGPVGQMAIRSALLLGAKQVIVIDRVPERLAMAKVAGAITINFDDESVLDRLKELTGGKGPEKCIDAVGMESHATRSFDAIYDRVKQAVMLETDRPHVLREMIYVCRPAGTLSVPGVYGGLIDKIPFGASMNKGLTWKMGQTHVNRWTDDLLRRIQEGQIDPSFVITHTVPLEEGPGMYKTFRDKEDGCIKVVLKL